jgi:S-formylglutathione hydrolase FrmB
MALIQVNFMSKTLFRTVPMQVILPVDKFTRPGMPVREDKPFKTLYLLHGLLGNYTDWVTETRIQKWASDKNLAVVMPSGDNSFYLDSPEEGNINNNFGEFIGKELVEVTRKMFPLSHDREDTYIAGLSMGGYGAIRNGLKYHETFGYIAGLSSAVHILEDIVNVGNRNIVYEESCFGKLDEAITTDKNPKIIVKNLKEKQASDEKIQFPKIYMACGTDDSLIDVNRAYRDFFTENGLEIVYYEEPGHHDWAFWDKYILKVLEWLPLEDSASGISSGNVRG